MIIYEYEYIKWKSYMWTADKHVYPQNTGQSQVNFGPEYEDLTINY